MIQNTEQTVKQTVVKHIRLADELDHLQNRISNVRLAREADCPEKQRVVTARRVKVSGGW